MRILKGIEPEKVLEHFESICQIPHGSGNTGELEKWLVAFGKERGLETFRDEIGNVTIIKEASEGYGESEPVILQTHMDMVCVKTHDSNKDMAKEGLDLATEGNLIYAKNTSLGADDGIGVAMALAVLDDASIKHPKIEAIMTVEEETGLYGAEAYDMSKLEGRRFINLDSEDEGILSVSCAGGVDVFANMPIEREEVNGEAIEISLTGLCGGHSGMEINKGYGNANKLLGMLLNELLENDNVRLVSINGGLADNAIPASAKAIVLTSDTEGVNKICSEYCDYFTHTYTADPGLSLTVSAVESRDKAIKQDFADKVIALLDGAPNGVQAMTEGLDDLPRTSLSLGIVKTNDDNIELIYCLRSSVDKEKYILARRVVKMVEGLGGEAKLEYDYPGWEYALESPLRDVACEAYKTVAGKEMTVAALHAGLECGYFVNKRDNLDCISMGPEISDVHSTNEKVYIDSMKRVWDTLVLMLENLK